MQKTTMCLFIGLLLSSTVAVGAKDEGRSGSWKSSTQGAPSLKVAKKLVEKNPKDAIANNDLGWAYRQNGDAAQAETYLREAVKLNPKMGQAHSNLSVVLFDANKLDEAQTEAAQAVAIDPNNAIYKVVLGNALAKKGDRKAALEQYRSAVQLRPDYENAQYNLGRVLLDDGQANEGKLVLVDALKLDPNDERVLKLLDQFADK